MKTYEFKDYLKRTFYHPSTNIEFPNGRLKAFYRHVISRLWDMQEFKVGDKTYTNPEIRYILSEKMIAEYFDMGDLMAMAFPKCFIQVSGIEDPIFPFEGAKEVYAKGRTAYEYGNMNNRCALIAGDGGHRFYADDAWAVVHEFLNRD